MKEREAVGDDVLHEVERFLYREARLLDERRFREWLELLTDDLFYRMTTRRNRYLRGSKAIAILDPERYGIEERREEDTLAILEETKESLAGRIARLDTGMAWAEDPPSRTRHLITNIEVEAGHTGSELEVLSNFIVYRNRGGSEQDFYVGARRDLLRREGGAWRLARRELVLDQNVLAAKNVSIFF